MNKSLSAIFFSVLFLCSSLAAHADKNSNAPQQENKWITEVRNYKHAFLIKETGMTEAQQKEFIPLYTEMEDKVYSTNREARNLEQQLSNSQEEANDENYASVATALSQVKEKEAEIENHYFELFSKILSKKQMFLLKRAENRFSIEMLNHNKRSKSSKAPNN